MFKFIKKKGYIRHARACVYKSSQSSSQCEDASTSIEEAATKAGEACTSSRGWGCVHRLSRDSDGDESGGGGGVLYGQ